MGKVVIGADLGGTNIKAGAVSYEGEILAQHRITTEAERGPQAVADRICQAARRCIELIAGRGAEVVGVGVGSPGTIDHDRGVVGISPNLPGFEGFALCSAVEEGMGLACVLENDANAAALGEQWIGAGRGADSLVMLTLGTGIGGGIVLGGRVWHGTGGFAAEIGHMSINPDGPTCGCGNRGCIEAYASAPAMGRRMRETIAEGRQTVLADRTGGFTARDIHAAALSGDEAARENIETTGRYLGVAISNVIHILNPAVVVLSGGVTGAGEMLMAPLRDEVEKRTLRDSLQGVRICFAELGEDAGFIGAARCFMTE